MDVGTAHWVLNKICVLPQRGDRELVKRAHAVWNRTQRLMSRVWEDLKGGGMLTWLRPLSTLSAAASFRAAQGVDKGPLLMEELLRLVLALHRAHDNNNCSLELDSSMLVSECSKLRVSAGMDPDDPPRGWSPEKYMWDEIAGNGRALATLLTQKWYSAVDNSVGDDIHPEAACILRALLSVPKGTEGPPHQAQGARAFEEDEKPDARRSSGGLDAWRPLVLALLKGTATLTECGSPSSDSLLRDSLRQVECLTFRLLIRNNMSGRLAMVITRTFAPPLRPQYQVGLPFSAPYPCHRFVINSTVKLVQSA